MEALVQIIKDFKPDEAPSVGVLSVFTQKKEEIQNLLSQINKKMNYSDVQRVVPLAKDLINALITIYELDTSENEDTKAWYDDTIKLAQSIVDKRSFLSNETTRDQLKEHITNTLGWIESDIEELFRNEDTDLIRIATGVERIISDKNLNPYNEASELGEELLRAYSNGDISDPALREFVERIITSGLHLVESSRPRADILVAAGIRLPAALRNFDKSTNNEVEKSADIPESIYWVTLPGTHAPVFRKIRETEMFDVSETWMQNFVLRSTLKESLIKKVIKEADTVLRAANPWLDEYPSQKTFDQMKKSERPFMFALERVTLFAKYVHSVKAQLSFSDIGARVIEISLSGVEG